MLAVYAVRRLAGAARRAGPGGADDRLVTPARRPTPRLPITWQACILYAVAFGGYVAFSVYLPAYLKTAYGLTPADAANRMAGFVVVAVIMRPVGGWLVRPVRRRSRCSPAASASSRSAPASPPATPPLDTSARSRSWRWPPRSAPGSGATFALIAQVTEPARVGGVTGLVGAAGGLGGFVPPLIMGYVYGRTDSYAIGLWLLAVTAALTLCSTAHRRPPHRRGHGRATDATTPGTSGWTARWPTRWCAPGGSSPRAGLRRPAHADQGRRPRRPTTSTGTAGATTRSSARRTG